MTGLLEGVLNASPLVVYVTVAFLVFAEDALFIGFVIPGETAAVLGGVAAAIDHVELVPMAVTVVLAAIIGDSVGFEVGRHFGPRILQLRLFDRHRVQLDRAQAFLRRRGGSAVFLGRFTAFFRATMPALAGLSQMPYRRFLAWNAIGGAVWGVLFVSLGHFAGHSYAALEKSVGRGLSLVVVGVAAVAFIIWRVRSERIDEVSEPIESDLDE